MSRTNCFLPSKGFCLNFRVRMVKSPVIASDAALGSPEDAGEEERPALEPK